MSQYPTNNQPPSYESVINSSGPEQISEVTTTQPAISHTYPVLPSAPMLQPQNQNYGSITEVIQSQPSTNQNEISDVTTIVAVNGCPICRIGVLEDDYSALGICLAILCFPCGILCCMCLKNKRCSSCGTII